MRVAILDSDFVRATRMSRSLSAAGYACGLCRNQDQLIAMVDSQLPDILLLGFDEEDQGILPLISQVKEKGGKRILLLVKAGQEARINGALFAGADDYLCLPLRQYELQIRISVLARQIMPDVKRHYYLKYGDYTFGRYPNDLTVMGKSTRLTAKEFDLALLFFRHIGMPLSRAHIAEAIWNMDGNEMVRTIDTHVSRVRNKLNLKPKNGFLLEQVYGFGYQLLALT